MSEEEESIQTMVYLQALQDAQVALYREINRHPKWVNQNAGLRKGVAAIEALKLRISR